jgi:hypothetical protein
LFVDGADDPFALSGVKLPDHQVHDVVGITLGVNAIQVPRPLPFDVIEDE